ncbi:MAG: glycosyltransferase family 2 protein [Acidimicrobiales bacterium]
MTIARLRVDVVTVNYRTAAEVQRLAADLGGLDHEGIDHRLLVVDCSGELVDGGVEVIDPGANIGFGAACNLGLERADAPLIAFINPDCLVDPKGLAAVIRAGDDEGAVAWTGALLNEDGSVQRNTAPAFTLRRLAAEYLLGVDTRLPAVRGRRTVHTITGAVLVCRTSDVRAVHGFDDRYPLYVEDVDLTDRLGARGAVVQFPDAVGAHFGGRSSGHAPAMTTTLLHASRIRWFRRRGRLRGGVARLVIVAGCAVRWTLRPRARPALDPAAIWRAGAARFPLAELLPPRPVAR